MIKARTGAYTLLGLAGICLLPFLRLAFFAHAYLDDFIFPVMLRRTGVWPHVGTMYRYWQGRFSASLITALHPLAWGGLAQVPLVVFGLIVAFAASGLFAGTALTAGHPEPVERLAAGSLVITIILVLLPSPTEAFYWLLSGLFYTGGVVCVFALLGAVAMHLRATSAFARRWWWGLAGVLAVLTPGFSEMISCFVLAFGLALAPLFWRRQVGAKWAFLLALAALSAAVATLAPGNFVRAGQYHVPGSLGRSSLLAAATCAYSIFSWLSNGLLLVLTLLVLPALPRFLLLPHVPLTRLTRPAWFWPAATVGGLLLSYVFAYVAVGAPPPSRARNVLFCFFVVGWWLSVSGGVAYFVRRGYALPALPGYARLALAGLLVLLLTTDHNVKLARGQVGAPTNSVSQAYRDWLSGDAAQYDREEAARYALIRRSPGQRVELPQLSVQPVTLVWWDISANPALWGNRAYAQYFHKKAIWVKP